MIFLKVLQFVALPRFCFNAVEGVTRKGRFGSCNWGGGEEEAENTKRMYTGLPFRIILIAILLICFTVWFLGYGSLI